MLETHFEAQLSEKPLSEIENEEFVLEFGESIEILIQNF